MISDLIFKSLINFGFIFYVVLSPVLFFSILLFTQWHLLKRSCFSYFVVFRFLSKASWKQMQRFISELSFSFIVCISVFIPGPCYFDYYSFIICIEISKHEASNFVFLSQDCFGILGFLDVPQILGFCYTYVKYTIGILINSVLNL